MSEITIHTGAAGDVTTLHIDWADHNNVRQVTTLQVRVGKEDKPRTLAILLDGVRVGTVPQQPTPATGARQQWRAEAVRKLDIHVKNVAHSAKHAGGTAYSRDMEANSLSTLLAHLDAVPVADAPAAQAPCHHEPYQGRCVHCDAVFVNGHALPAAAPRYQMPPDATPQDWRAAVTKVYLATRRDSGCQGVPSTWLDAMREMLAAAPAATQAAAMVARLREQYRAMQAAGMLTATEAANYARAAEGLPPLLPPSRVPYVRASVDSASGLHELWLCQQLEDGSVTAIAGPAPWPPGWAALRARAAA